MTQTEQRLIKVLAVLVILAASVPAGAIFYRVVTDDNLGLEFVFPWTATSPPATVAATAVAAAAPPPVEGGTAVNKWLEYIVSDQGFAISIPDTWQRLPMNPSDLNALLANTRAQNPELAATLGANAQTLIQSGIRFWAYDADPTALRSNVATTLTVLKRSLPSPVSLETYVQLNVNQISGMKTRVGAIGSRRLMLNGMPAQQLQYTISFTQPDGTSFLSAVSQYLLVNNADAYVIGFATAPANADRYAQIFYQTATTFRLLQP